MITKENVHVRREFNYHRIGSEHQHGRFGPGRREFEDLDFSQYCNSSNAREFAREESVAGGKKALSLISDFQ